ncbi:hypothetical protein [Streptomyces antimycoticus]|uniref:hypothetical protein n=1 Tax=Streptomyces antimycoticus TaxID=68175 RepID=UPI00223FBCB7|nr:hypothetical protein [Streptomyces antimycoticus]
MELGCSQKTVFCWLHRFNRLGLQGRMIWEGRAASRGSRRRNGQGSIPWSRPVRAYTLDLGHSRWWILRI